MCWCDKIKGSRCEDCECEERFSELSTREKMTVQKILKGIEENDTSVEFRSMANKFEDKHGDVHNYNFNGVEYWK